MTKDRREVVVVGGGIAGLTAAWKLAARPGFHVTLVEAEAEVGGQARAFVIDGRTVEHGSHAFFGYYRTILELIAELRADAALAPDMPRLEPLPGWTLVDPYGRRALLTHTPGLPPIVSVAPSILKVPWFTVGDKLRALVGAYKLARRPLADYDALDEHTSYDAALAAGYSPVGALTWNFASLGLTNLFVQEQSAAILAGKHAVLIGTPRGLSYQLPAGNLSHLYAIPARRKLEALGGVVRTGARVVALEPDAARVTVRLDGGEALVADDVILAVQPWDARALLPAVRARWTELGPVTPVITGVVGLSGRVHGSSDARELGMSREHWAFSVVTDLSRFWPEYAGDHTTLRAEIGHADLLPAGVDTPDAQLLAVVKRDLDRLYPEARGLDVAWFRAHRETRHLYVKWTRGEFRKRIRPEERAAAPRVYVAGDWTTRGIIGMEAAANSGLEAASWVLERTGLERVPFHDVPLR